MSNYLFDKMNELNAVGKLLMEKNNILTKKRDFHRRK